MKRKRKEKRKKNLYIYIYNEDNKYRITQKNDVNRKNDDCSCDDGKKEEHIYKSFFLQNV